MQVKLTLSKKDPLNLSTKVGDMIKIEVDAAGMSGVYKVTKVNKTNFIMINVKWYMKLWYQIKDLWYWVQSLDIWYTRIGDLDLWHKKKETK